MEKIEYKGWPNCYRLSNGIVDVIVTTDIGPRIIRFGFVDEANEFKEYAEMIGKTGGDEWRIYGGHRLWHAPESDPRTYFPDNAPVAHSHQEQSGVLHVSQIVEPTTGIKKDMDIRLTPNVAHMRVTHHLSNQSLWPIELAPWSLSVMAQGGTAILPLPPRGTHPEMLQPTSTITLWAFTDMTDARWNWGAKYILLRQDNNVAKPQKVGALVKDGWAAYARDNHLFVKLFRYQESQYPDLGSVVETFTNDEMLELETLGPVQNLAPGAGAAPHIEDWFLFRDVPMPHNDADVERDVLPRVLQARDLQPPFDA